MVGLSSISKSSRRRNARHRPKGQLFIGISGASRRLNAQRRTLGPITKGSEELVLLTLKSLRRMIYNSWMRWITNAN
jgi:hypothetical protein